MYERYLETNEKYFFEVNQIGVWSVPKTFIKTN